MNLIVKGANAVGSLNMRSPDPLKKVVPPDDTILVYNSLRVATSPSMEHWKEVS